MSRRPYELSAAARLDVLQIWNYLAENAPFAIADKVSKDIESAVREIAKSPNRGHKRPDLTDRQVLFFLVHSYLIIYRPNKKPLHVLRVAHAARDISGMLEE
jgi:plasmid stabilization system protein ParE